ncbi:MAG: (Fe-S)-binding protein [Candidatus Helarchaeota archaeon]
MTETDSILRYLEEIYCCTRCSTCKYIYHVYDLSCPSGVKFRFETFYPSGKIHLARGLIEEKLEWSDRMRDIVFACPTCANCTIQCQARHHAQIVEIIEALRADAVSKGFGPLPSQKAFADSVEKEHNPYKEEHNKRTDWAEGLELPQKEKAEVLYFVGCTSSYRQQELARKTIKILNKLGVDYTVSKDEWCCGSPLIRTGQLKQVKELVKNNINLIKRLGVKTVISSCAGCYRTLKKDYPKYTEELNGIKILHITEFLLEVLKKVKLKFKKPQKIKITYHDPCHLGRHSEVYDAPRAILEYIPGVELIEMGRNRENAWCCGAGGGVKSGFKDWAIEIASERIKEAEETDAEILVSSCPFCKTNLQDAINDMNSNIKFMDIVELLDEFII